MERHLSHMREWYRQKLRELAEGRREDRGSKIEDRGTEDEEARHILPMNEEIDEGDQKLGELLQSLELVDADSLSALLVEARKQRRSLRQMLLSSSFVTLYQMAMIEAGNFDRLVLGPVRVMDRLRSTAQETVYRVFDPRRNAASEPPASISEPQAPISEPGALATGKTPPSPYALLRHLAESAMQNAAWVKEFCSRFASAAQLQHANLAATWEVLDIHGRPAVLQEWLTGLPSSDWPSLASVPSVWFRLLRQAAQGLHAAQSAGLVHGHLQANRILLTAEGIVKIAGFGEPDWLVASQKPEARGPRSEVRTPSFNPEPTARDADVADLCRIAAAWAAPSAKKKAGKNKPFPKPLRAILDRLKAEDDDSRYSSPAPRPEGLN